MIYIIISNVGMAIMMIFIYFRYWRFRVAIALEAQDLREQFEEKSKELIDADRRFLQEKKVDNEKVQALLLEIDDLRKAKENELKLRLNAEKQIELTLQKTEDLETRLDDWQVVQDSVMLDCKDAIYEIGNDLYKRLSDVYKQEAEVNKNLVEKLSENISDLFDKFPETTSVQKVAVGNAVQESSFENHSKKSMPDLLQDLEAKGFSLNKDYFLPESFDEQRAKLMLCELAFISARKLYLIDSKACRYLAEYDVAKVRNKAAAQDQLKQKFEKYLAYLSNPKYRVSILRALPTSLKFQQSAITIILPSSLDTQVIKEIGYYEKIRNLEIEISDFNNINNLIS